MRSQWFISSFIMETESSPNCTTRFDIKNIMTVRNSSYSLVMRLVVLGYIWCISTGLLPVAGFLRDRLGVYDVAFYLAGIPPLFGGALLCLIPWVEMKRRRSEKMEALKQEPEVSTRMLEKHQEDSQLQTGESALWNRSEDRRTHTACVHEKCQSFKMSLT